MDTALPAGWLALHIFLAVKRYQVKQLHKVFLLVDIMAGFAMAGLAIAVAVIPQAGATATILFTGVLIVLALALIASDWVVHYGTRECRAEVLTRLLLSLILLTVLAFRASPDYWRLSVAAVALASSIIWAMGLIETRRRRFGQALIMLGLSIMAVGIVYNVWFFYGFLVLTVVVNVLIISVEQT